jgi:urease accessory protein
MIELAETYLGNSTETPSLSEQIEKARSLEHCLEVYLNQTDSRKGRIHTHSTSGIEIGIIKNRDWSLREGDVFATQQGKLLLVHLQKQKVMVLSFTEPVSNYAIELVHLGHVLGNHHWPIIIQGRKLYVQLAADADVMEATLRNFQIPGLQIDYESRSPDEQIAFSEHTHQHQEHTHHDHG